MDEDLKEEILISVQDDFIEEMERQGEITVDEERNLICKGEVYSCLEDLLGNEPDLEAEFETWVEEAMEEVS